METLTPCTVHDSPIRGALCITEFHAPCIVHALPSDLCAEMVAKNAPAPPAAFLHSFIAASSLVGQHASAKDVLRADHIPSVPGGLEQQSVRGSGAAAGRNARGSAGGMQPFAHPSAQAGGTQQQLASSLDHQKQQRQQHQQQQPSVQRAALQYQSLVGSTVFPITGW